MTQHTTEPALPKAASSQTADRDLVALGIAIAAIVLFVGTSGSLMPQIWRAWFANGAEPDLLLTNAVLLNIALLIFGWRRYRDLHREVAERRAAEDVARQLAEVDPLTGCRNRRSGIPAIEELREASFKHGNDLAVMMVDLDNFKKINDLNGHQIGDRVLVTIAKRMQEVLPSDSILARIGGDEFVCAVPFTAGQRKIVDDLAEQLIEIVSTIIEDGDVRVEATVSIGIVNSRKSIVHAEQLDAEALVHQADIAMYHAKKHGRNRYFWFEKQMEDELRFRNELESGIRRGIPKGEFVPYYEQQIDLQTGAIVGFEMLARWNSPQYGVVSPEIFIPIAEEINLISELSESLMWQALQDAKTWDDSLTLSINISPLQLRDPWFAQKLLQTLLESGFPPRRLEVEITESSLLNNLAAVRSIVTSLKNQGIKVSLDDFGTGYSSLSRLQSLPFDRLKIDRSFITTMAENGGATQLVESIIALGKSMSLPITAEGIESPEVLAALQKMGEFKGQGYLYGYPEDANATRKRLHVLGLLSAEQVTEVAPEEPGPPAHRQAS